MSLRASSSLPSSIGPSATVEGEIDTGVASVMCTWETDVARMLFLSLEASSASLDGSAKSGETPYEILVAAIDVDSAAYLGDTVRSQPGKHECCASPDVG